MSDVSLSLQTPSRYENNVKKVLAKAGYYGFSKITNTLQGSIWRCKSAATKKKCVIKVANKELYHKSMSIHKGQTIHVPENIGKEKKILKKLTIQSKNVPKSIVKYKTFFKSNINYFLVMEDGGHSLFNFIIKSHQYISAGLLSIKHWHKVIKIIFKQIVESISFIHSKNICHFDISLENILIDDIDIIQNNDNGKIVFCCDDIQIKICDFGLAEQFNINSNKCLTNKYCGKQNYQSPEIVSKNKVFNAKSNDIWCLGVCLFMMIIGGQPFDNAGVDDTSFNMIMNNQINSCLSKWNRSQYVTPDLIQLFSLIFKYENERCTLQDIQQCKWMQ